MWCLWNLFLAASNRETDWKLLLYAKSTNPLPFYQKKALQTVMKAAHKITGFGLPTITDIYTSRCRKRATCFRKDPSGVVYVICLYTPYTVSTTKTWEFPYTHLKVPNNTWRIIGHMSICWNIEWMDEYMLHTHASTCILSYLLL